MQTKGTIKRHKNKWKRAFHFSYEHALVWHSCTTQCMKIHKIFIMVSPCTAYLMHSCHIQFSETKKTLLPRTENSTFVFNFHPLVRQAFFRRFIRAINGIANGRFWMLIIFFPDTVFNVMLVKYETKSTHAFHFLRRQNVQYIPMWRFEFAVFSYWIIDMSYAALGAINSTSVRITRAKHDIMFRNAQVRS